MARTVLHGALLVAIGAAVGAWIAWRGSQPTPGTDGSSPRATTSGLRPAAAPRDRAGEQLAQRLERLSATLAAEASERRRLEDRLEQMEEELAALRPAADGSPSSATAAAPPAPDAVASSSAPVSGAAEAQSSAADGETSATERALIAAGVDPNTAADIRRRRDELTLWELYLRDQAGREEWLDTPQFKEEMAEIERQRTSMRDEIGDDAYDRYLAALGEPNRVTVAEVLLDSAAAQAGLQSGDVVLRYGDARVFAPEELVAETRAGNAGETVRIQVLRNGRRIEIDVPRGPLGLRIAAGHGDPNGS